MTDELKIQKSTIISSKTTPISKDYIMGKSIGTGAFGTVRLCVHKATRQTRACKILKKATQDINSLKEEVEILSKLSHPNIMQLYEVYNDKTNFYIVSEFCQGGELFDAISKKGNFNENEASKIMKQVLSAITYSHQNNIVHRDLKPENILLEDKGNDSIIKIIDWGCAKNFNKNEKLTNKDGTPYYIAPEVLEGYYDEKCDIWSCGVILYIMLCGYPPFDGENEEEILDKVKKGNFEFPKEEWKNISKDAIDLIEKMLTFESNKRISALECLSHKWFIKNKNKNISDKKTAKNIINNMKKFKRGKKLEQASISFIVNQLISKDERKELIKQFQDWDTNGDGVLSRDEIIEGYRKTYGAVDENEIDNIMKSIDLDGNGVIDYNEFLSCAFNRDKIMSKDNLELTFKAFDSDGSGKISAEELMNVFMKGDKSGNLNKEVFEKMVKDADQNGDGEISFDEFKNIMTKFFS